MLSKTHPKIPPGAANWLWKNCFRVFDKRGWMLSMSGNRDRVMYACEDPKTIVPFQLAGKTLPLPQSLQMGLEEDILEHPDCPGLWTYGISFRKELTSGTDNRRNQMFPMIEFECRGGLFDTLLPVYDEIFASLGFQSSGSENGKFPRVEYMELLDRYGVEEIGEEEEMRIQDEYGPVVFLINFPENTHPFWNMRRDPNTGLAKKCDVIVGGRESAGSAERETDKEVMKNRFLTIENGLYAMKLYDTYGRDRVDSELNTYLDSHEFFVRSGAGLGVTRILQAAHEHGLLKELQ
jgi:aspartyl/asparaginyl-tRNA synthetase